MKYLSIIFSVLITFYACQPTAQNEEQQDEAEVETVAGVSSDINTLSKEEADEGWILLFDGQTTSGWHNYKKETVEGWEVVEGVLMTQGGSGDIVTNAAYENFELSFEWKIAPEGNSGVIYLVEEADEYGSTFETGPEYQIIDDENYPAELKENQKSGANYALHPPMVEAAKPAGEFNTATIIVDNGLVEHWLNGQKVVEYELWTEEWENMVKETKFVDMPGYGKSKSGHIALQDHGDQVSFRNIKIRER